MVLGVIGVGGGIGVVFGVVLGWTPIILLFQFTHVVMKPNLLMLTYI